MKGQLKKLFIPHEENDYHPHILHTKRALFYTGFFLSLKALVFLFALLIPSVAFVMPDVLEQEEQKLLTLTNNFRRELGLSTLVPYVPLSVSALNKATDMASYQYFSHINPNNIGLEDFLTNAGYNYQAAGENLAMGFGSAEEIFAAWLKSPSHYANLVDPDFTEFGVSMQLGMYNQYSTVYVAEHFGNRKQFSSTFFPSSAEPSSALPIDSNHDEKARSVSSISYNEQNSFLEWKEEKQNVIFTAQIMADGPIQKATVIFGKYFLPVEKQPDGLYRGQLSVSEPINNFFTPVIEPTLQIIDTDNTTYSFILPWKEVKIVSPSPLEKYTMAKNMDGFPFSVFEFSRGVYLFFIIFFSGALLLSICIEIRRQHHHVITQTLGLILLLMSLFLI